MTGDMHNGQKEYKDVDKQPIKTIEGLLKADFDKESAWKGNLTSEAGSVDLSLKNGSRWNGDLSAQASDGATTVNLQNDSKWEGQAAGNGDISLTENSLWHLTGNSEASSVSLDGTSTVSLAGEASKLEDSGWVVPADSS